MKFIVKTCLISIVLGSLTGCVVYEPRPRVYATPGYVVYDAPAVVVVHGGGYYHFLSYQCHQ
jgi:hypothetical protein